MRLAKSRNVYFSLFILVTVVLSLLLVSGCAEKVIDEEEQQRITRAKIGLKSITKWNVDKVNQMQIFDEKGRKIEERWYNPKGIVVTSRKLHYHKKDHNPYEVVWYKGVDILKSTYHYEYDNKGNRIQEIWLSSLDELKTKTDISYEDNRVKEMIVYGTRENLVSKRSYLYGNDFLIEYLETNAQGEIINRQKYYQDENGKKAKEEWYNKEGELQSKRFFGFDGDLLKEKLIYKNGDEFEYRITYEYDHNNMLTKESWFDEEGKTVFENIYTFEHY